LTGDVAGVNAYVFGGAEPPSARKLLHPALESAPEYAQFGGPKGFSTGSSMGIVAMGIVTKRCFLCGANKGIL
jgi:hypothetical protein